MNAEVHMHDYLLSDAYPDVVAKNFLDSLNQNNLKVVTAFVEPSWANAEPDDKFQFERHGCFVAGWIGHQRRSRCLTWPWG